MVHIGNKIKEVIETEDITIALFARRINKSRTVVYHIFDRESLDSKLLYVISKELEFNFFELYFPKEDYQENTKNMLPIAREPIKEYEEASYKMKYYTVLEKYNRLLEKMVRR